jgi:hypothetical protein
MRRLELMGAQPRKSAITAVSAAAQAGCPRVRYSESSRLARGRSVWRWFLRSVCMLAGVVQPVQVDVFRAETREASLELPGR